VNLSGSSMELNSSLKELRILWEETQAVWNDSVRRDFEEHHLMPFVAQVTSLLRAVERLSPVLEKVQHDCR
jgi:hypothetical protein